MLRSAGSHLPYDNSVYSSEFTVLFLWLLVEPVRIFLGTHRLFAPVLQLMSSEQSAESLFTVRISNQGKQNHASAATAVLDAVGRAYHRTLCLLPGGADLHVSCYPPACTILLLLIHSLTSFKLRTLCSLKIDQALNAIALAFIGAQLLLSFIAFAAFNA